MLLWQKIKDKSYGVRFNRQVPIDNYIVDFYCKELQLVIEIDGNSHEHKFVYDKRRQDELEYYGLAFLRFHDIDVKINMQNVLRSIELKISELRQTSP